jgi:hypothetical protein
LRLAVLLALEKTDAGKVVVSNTVGVGRRGKWPLLSNPVSEAPGVWFDIRCWRFDDGGGGFC